MQQPTIPRPPATPQPHIVDVGSVPTTGQEVQALRIKLTDLRDELQDAASRRRTISNQLRSTDSRARPGLEERMGVLDQRIVQIEKEITATGTQLRSASSSAIIAGSAAMPDPGTAFVRASQEIVPIVGILSVFVFAPIALAIARLIWRRASAPPKQTLQNDQATHQRLDQLQQAVDAIAIEVERISEGQRFVTKLFSDGDRALGPGAAEPVRPSKRSAAAAVERG